MIFWENIVNTSMIGTDKKNIVSTEMPQNMVFALAFVDENMALDNEEKFLQYAALAYNYKQCGLQPINKQHIDLPLSPSEEKTYCSETAMQALKNIFDEENIPLIKYWLQHCQQKNYIVHPEIIPRLFNYGASNKYIQLLIANCCGKRGEWLSKFNDDWNFSVQQSTDDIWQTGSAKQREEIWKDTLETKPALARIMLMQTWAQEEANSKLNFLGILKAYVTDEDIPFLSNLENEKSKKIKEASIDLLKHIPNSSIVTQYTEVLEKSIFYKKEKTLLGFSSKMVLQFQLPSNIDENIYKTGIEKLSDKKDLTDDEFILHQFISAVPPSFWEKHFNTAPSEIIKQFQENGTGKKMMPALVIATKKFKDFQWALAIMQYSKTFYIDIIPMLPQQQQEFYSNKYFQDFSESIIKYCIEWNVEWSMELTQNIFKYTSINPYQYNRNFYSQNIQLIPEKIKNELKNIGPAEEHLKNSWLHISEYIIKLLHLKSQTILSFT